MKCYVPKCNDKIQTKGLCSKHYDRFRNHSSFEKRSSKGNRNVNWKGGIAEYPNHYLMKKNRLIILLQNPKCEICGKLATEIHHKDFTKINRKLSNLQAVCHKCNSRLSSKFYKRYGLNLEEITKKFGYSIFYWWKHQDKLSFLLTK